MNNSPMYLTHTIVDLICRDYGWCQTGREVVDWFKENFPTDEHNPTTGGPWPDLTYPPEVEWLIENAPNENRIVALHLAYNFGGNTVTTLRAYLPENRQYSHATAWHFATAVVQYFEDNGFHRHVTDNQPELKPEEADSVDRPDGTLYLTVDHLTTICEQRDWCRSGSEAIEWFRETYKNDPPNLLDRAELHALLTGIAHADNNLVYSERRAADYLLLYCGPKHPKANRTGWLLDDLTEVNHESDLRPEQVDAVLDFITNTGMRPTIMENQPSSTTGGGRAFLQNDQGQVVILAGGDMTTVPSDHDKRDEILQALNSGDYDRAINLADRTVAVRKFLSQDEGVAIVDDDGFVTIDGQPIDAEVGQKAIDMMEEGLAPTPLINFLQLLQLNPKASIRQELLPFLAANDFAIDEDGLIVAWKKVTTASDGSLTDPYTETLDYTPPRTVTMPRDQVDDDPTRSCAPGLHFATWDFTYNYTAGSRVVELRVNPRDVVSIPTAHVRKGRACTFHIEREIPNWRDLDAEDVTPSDGVVPSSSTAYQMD